MTMFSLWKSKVIGSTKFSEFIREASSEEKKRVYTEVLKKATERQRATMSDAARRASRT